MKFQNAGIMLALLDYPFVENECVRSFFSMFEYSKYLCPGNGNPKNNVEWAMLDGTSPARAHNHAIQAFLDRPEFKSLLIVGHDHIFRPDALKILFEADKDMIGGITCQRVRGLSTLNKPILSIVNDWKDGKTRALTRDECIERMNKAGNEPFEVPSMGDGFMLFKRKVFERIDPPWFYEPPIPKDQVKPGQSRGTLGCDISFFEEARKLGFEVWAHPKVQYVHIGRGYTAIEYDIGGE